MGLRINRRIGLGRGVGVNLGRTGASVTRRSALGSIGLGRRGLHGSIRLARGISWRWGR